MILIANDETRTIHIEETTEIISTEKALQLFREGGHINNMSIKTERLLSQFDGDWDALAEFYANAQ